MEGRRQAGGPSRTTVVIMSIVVGAFIVRDFMNPTDIPAPYQYKNRNSIQTRLILGPWIRFQYCSSCGYHSKFLKFSEMLEDKFPKVQIHGEVYPTNFFISWIAQAVAISKFIFIFFLFGGVDVSPYINQYGGVKARRFWNWICTNKIYASLMIFFLCNLAQSHLTANGAFEIYFDEVRIWSKLETGRVPTSEELLELVEQRMIEDVEGSVGEMPAQ